MAFPCGICGKTFSRKSNRHRHIETLHKVKEEPIGVYIQIHPEADEAGQVHIGPGQITNDDIDDGQVPTVKQESDPLDIETEKSCENTEL